VIVRWRALPGAIGYDVRSTYRNKYVQWSFYRKTQRPFKARTIPKKGTKVQVRARNDDGFGPKRTIRVKL
jgi:hypothetical protein